MKKLFLLAIVVLGFTAVSFGQASALVNATLTTGIGITKNVDMNFGSFSKTGAGTLELATNGDLIADLTIIPASPTGTAAEFTVTGTGNDSFSITLPSDVAPYSITRAGGTGAGDDLMTVTVFNSDPVDGSANLVYGTKVLKVGAMLTISATQNPGNYTNATGFEVTVNY